MSKVAANEAAEASFTAGGAIPEPSQTGELIGALAERVAAGDTRAVARACRIVDERAPGSEELLDCLAPGRAWIVGITGAPGAGKSSIVQALITELRPRFARIAVIAVDPTSPHSGGALLGDRIRMQQHFLDPGVFIRSIANRGALGGLSRTAWDLVRVVSAWGAEVVLMETVGVGQDELDVALGADTTLVVMAPGNGDDVQASKAGLLECADTFVVNKSERGAGRSLVAQLEGMLALGESTGVRAPSAGHAAHRLLPPTRTSDAWLPPIVETVATEPRGVDVLCEALQRHRIWRDSPAGALAATERTRRRVTARLRQRVEEWIETGLESTFAEIAERVVSGADESIAIREFADTLSDASSLVGDFRRSSDRNS